MVTKSKEASLVSRPVYWEKDKMPETFATVGTNIYAPRTPLYIRLRVKTSNCALSGMDPYDLLVRDPVTTTSSKE